jgi:hypothetical protein
MKIHGACHCGFITFEAEADPEKASICHCTDCQASTGAAFRTNIPVPAKDFKLLSGQPAIYVKTTADSGNPREQAFCPKCGSPIYSTNPGPTKTAYMVRIGILKERDQLPPKVQNWTRSAQKWLGDISGIRSNEKGAPPP